MQIVLHSGHLIGKHCDLAWELFLSPVYYFVIRSDMLIGQAGLTDVLLINSAIEDPRFVLMSRTHAWFEDFPT